MIDADFFKDFGRKTIITGHYGSGKTEFAVSLAMLTAEIEKNQNIALIDLDVVNPYFRSREKRDMLEKAGISVYGSLFTEEITAELPALGATVRAPLEDKNSRVIVDLGGNDTGALIINQFAKYFQDSDTITVAVVNANRPDTQTVENTLEHIKSIEKITELKVTGIVNNTHLLSETTVADIIKGHKLCSDLCKTTNRKLMCSCYPKGLIDPKDLNEIPEPLMPLGLYLRPSWLM
ncbi:MAG: ATP-binding protein [Oscillospiraceae bacterium]|nr:ATP-binding protein [Oscillospiraceae bacterium]